MSSRTPSLPKCEVQIHPTRTFANAIEIASESLGSAMDRFMANLVAAFEEIKARGFDRSLPIKQYGPVGDSFEYSLGEGYSFTFRIVTDRDSDKHPIREHFYLKDILRE